MSDKQKSIKKYIKNKIGDYVMEKFVVIDGNTTSYIVRSDGTILSTMYQGYKRKEPYVMKGGCDSYGYHHVVLSIDGKKYTKKIHRLVANAFIPNPDNKPEVNHIDGNKFNNDVSNLEWVTTKENVEHAKNTGLRNKKKMRKLIENICMLLETNEYSMQDICNKLNVDKWLIKSIIKKKIWVDVSKKYNISNYNHKDHNETVHTIRKPSISKKICRKICEDIESDNISLIEISRKYGVQKYDVLKVYHGKLYPEISKDYNFTKYTKRTYKYFKGGKER